jgi:hypothetical protein
MAKSSLTAGSVNRVRSGLTSRIDAISTDVGQRIAEDLRQEIVLNLTAGGGTTALSRRGYRPDQPVRRGQGYSHVASGATFRSLKVTPARRGFSRVWRVEIGGSARELNYGVRPGANIDLGRLTSWVVQSGLASRANANAAGVARRLAARIKARGMAPTRFYTDAEAKIRRRVNSGYYKPRKAQR